MVAVDLLILVDQNHQPKIQVIQRSSQSISQFPDASRAQLIDLPQELLSNNQLTLGLFVLADFGTSTQQTSVLLFRSL